MNIPVAPDSFNAYTSGNHFTPVGITLKRVEAIEYNQEFSKYRDTDFVLMCDVNNPLPWGNGCTAVFSPQKGTSPEAVKRLEAGAEWLSGTVRRVMGREEPDTPGAGAAGGLGFGALSFFGARVKNGVNTVLDMYEFEKHLEDADVVITDEGKLDFQSIMGKAAGGVIARTKSKTCIVLCGSNEAESLPKGVSAVSISEGAALATP